MCDFNQRLILTRSSVSPTARNHLPNAGALADWHLADICSQSSESSSREFSTPQCRRSIRWLTEGRHLLTMSSPAEGFNINTQSSTRQPEAQHTVSFKPKPLISKQSHHEKDDEKDDEKENVRLRVGCSRQGGEEDCQAWDCPHPCRCGGWWWWWRWWWWWLCEMWWWWWQRVGGKRMRLSPRVSTCLVYVRPSLLLARSGCGSDDHHDEEDRHQNASWCWHCG